MTKTTGMKAGPLRYQVTIQRPEVDTDERGEAIVTSWVKVATVYAAIEPLSGREWLASAQFRPGVTTRIRIRWRDGIDASMRVLHRSTVYNIDAVIPQFQGMSEAHLMCGDGVITEGGQP
jgi:SPP1 family predicted phage head-tail adaptor